MTSTKSAEPEFRTGPVGEATDRCIPFGRGAGQELEHVLHLRHYLERHIHARLACKIRQLAAVVDQRLISPGLDIDRWETFEVGMQRIGQRVLAIASFAEKRAGRTDWGYARPEFYGVGAPKPAGRT